MLASVNFNYHSSPVCRVLPQFVDALAEEGLVEMVDVDADAEVLQEEHGELPAQVLAELIQAGEDRSAT